MGEMVEIAANANTAQGYFSTATNPRPGIVVIQEWWGLDEHIKDIADRFGDSGFCALAPDLFGGEVTKDPGRAGEMMLNMDFAGALAKLSAAVDFLLANDQVAGDKVGVVGFCMGGGLALGLAAERPDAVAAAVPFYGVIPWEDATPDFSAVEASILGHYAELDDFAPPEHVDELEARLRGHGIEVTIRRHSGVEHAFFNDTRPEVYNEDAAADAWQECLDFLDDNLK